MANLLLPTQTTFASHKQKWRKHGTLREKPKKIQKFHKIKTPSQKTKKWSQKKPTTKNFLKNANTKQLFFHKNSCSSLDEKWNFISSSIEHESSGRKRDGSRSDKQNSRTRRTEKSMVFHGNVAKFHFTACGATDDSDGASLDGWWNFYSDGLVVTVRWGDTKSITINPKKKMRKENHKDHLRHLVSVHL